MQSSSSSVPGAKRRKASKKSKVSPVQMMLLLGPVRLGLRSREFITKEVTSNLTERKRKNLTGVDADRQGVLVTTNINNSFGEQ